MKSDTEHQGINRDQRRIEQAQAILNAKGISATEIEIRRIRTPSKTRKRERITVAYKILSFHEGQQIDAWRFFDGLRFEHKWDDLTRCLDRSCSPSLKSMQPKDIAKYLHSLCEEIGTQLINVEKEKGAIFVEFEIKKGRFAGRQGRLDKNTLLSKVNSEAREINDPRTLLDDDERVKWLSSYLEGNNCKLISKNWPGSRGRCSYECPEGHLNTPTITNLLKSSNKYSCSPCNDQPIQVRRILRDRAFAEQIVSFYFVKTYIHPDGEGAAGDGFCQLKEPRRPCNQAAKIGYTIHKDLTNRSIKYFELIHVIRCKRAIAAASEAYFINTFSNYSLAKALKSENHKDDGYSEMFELALASHSKAKQEMIDRVKQFSDIENALAFLKKASSLL